MDPDSFGIMAKQSKLPDERAPSILAFGRAVRRIRTERGMTQEQVAWSVNMSRSFFREVDAGLREPGWSSILRIAEALGVTVVELVTAAVEELAKEEPRRRKKSTTRTPPARTSK